MFDIADATDIEGICLESSSASSSESLQTITIMSTITQTKRVVTTTICTAGEPLSCKIYSKEKNISATELADILNEARADMTDL